MPDLLGGLEQAGYLRPRMSASAALTGPCFPQLEHPGPSQLQRCRQGAPKGNQDKLDPSSGLFLAHWDHCNPLADLPKWGSCAPVHDVLATSTLSLWVPAPPRRAYTCGEITILIHYHTETMPLFARRSLNTRRHKISKPPSNSRNRVFCFYT